MGLVAVRLAQREKPLEGLLTAEDTLAVIAALVTHLRVDWPSGAEAEVGDLTAAAAKGSEEAGLESLFLGGRGVHYAVKFYNLLQKSSANCIKIYQCKHG